MTTKNYKQTLITAYRDRELSQVDFADTVDHFEKLVRGEYYESDSLEEDANTFADSALSMVDSLLSEDYKTGFKEGIQKYIESRCVIDSMINELSEEDPTDMKSKLKDGFTVVYRRGEERIVKGDKLHQESGVPMNELKYYTDNLVDVGERKHLDIISIRDTNNVEIWKRNDKDEWVEMEQEDAENMDLAECSYRPTAQEIKRAFPEQKNPLPEFPSGGFSPRHEGFKPNFTEVKLLKGILPRKQFEQDRIIEIGQAIIRYTEAGKQVPSEWITELNELTK